MFFILIFLSNSFLLENKSDNSSIDLISPQRLFSNKIFITSSSIFSKNKILFDFFSFNTSERIFSKFLAVKITISFKSPLADGKSIFRQQKRFSFFNCTQNAFFLIFSFIYFAKFSLIFTLPTIDNFGPTILSVLNCFLLKSISSLLIFLSLASQIPRTLSTNELIPYNSSSRFFIINSQSKKHCFIISVSVLNQ